MCISEVSEPNNSRSWLPQFDNTKKKEIDVLLRKGATKIFLTEYLPIVAHISEGRFELTIKDAAAGQEVHKARFVVLKSTDTEKMLTNNLSSIKQQSSRLLTGMAAIFNSRM